MIHSTAAYLEVIKRRSCQVPVFKNAVPLDHTTDRTDHILGHRFFPSLHMPRPTMGSVIRCHATKRQFFEKMPNYYS